MKIAQHKNYIYLALSCLVAFCSLSFSYHPSLFFGDEICDNAIDDDNDGLIDLNDPDCECELIPSESFIPNPSFEDIACCPDDITQLECATGWIQASEPTTDYLNTCGWLGWPGFPPPVPFPDGDGIIGFRDGRLLHAHGGTSGPLGNWKEYAGACLLVPLDITSVYRMEFDVGFVDALKSPPIDITLFGTANCNNLPFGIENSRLGCPTNGSGWVKLGSILVDGGSGGGWVHTSFEFTTEIEIKAIAIGPACERVIDDVSNFYFFDNLFLADIGTFDFYITKISHPCQNDFSLEIPHKPNFSYQWFKDGVALIGENSHQLSQAYGEGSYQIQAYDDLNNCKISSAYTHSVPTITANAEITICKEDVYVFGTQELTEAGIYMETFKSSNNCDSLVTLQLNVLGITADTIGARIFEGQSFSVQDYTFKEEGEHLITLTSSLGCDSLVVLKLDYYHVYIPNVFSPNRDGFNDKFKIFSGDTELVKSINLTIFDRWGARVYNGTEWDGDFRGKLVSPGAYIYVVQLIMEDGNEAQYSGDVLVVR